MNIYANRGSESYPVPSLIEGATTNCRAEDELLFEARTNLSEYKMNNIYKITNTVNNKVYIGVTTRTIEERFREHKSRIEERNNLHLYQAMKKYGSQNFNIELIDTAETTEEMFNKEKEYIKKYDSYYNGYNLTLGGEGVKKLELDEQYLAEQYLNGRSSEDLARELNVSGSTIRRRLKSMGIELTWHQYPEEMYDYIIQEYLKPRLGKEIAEELGISYDIVSHTLRKNNIPRNRFTKSYPNGRKWYEEYRNGTSIGSLSNKYNIDRRVLSRLFSFYTEIDKLKI